MSLYIDEYQPKPHEGSFIDPLLNALEGIMSEATPISIPAMQADLRDVGSVHVSLPYVVCIQTRKHVS